MSLGVAVTLMKMVIVATAQYLNQYKPNVADVRQQVTCGQSMAYNSTIYETKIKAMKATAIGLWYVQIPNIFVVNPFGEVINPKVYKGNKVIIDKRKQISVSKLPHLNYDAAMNFKNIFCD